jgi:hypothetical protein
VIRIAYFAIFLLLCACATTSDVVQVGPNRYQVSALAAPARGGVAGAEQHAAVKAGQKCVAMGKTVNVLGVETGHEFPVNGTAVMTFECNQP